MEEALKHKGECRAFEDFFFFFSPFLFISLMFESMNSSGRSAVSRHVIVIRSYACCLWWGGVFAQVEARQSVVKKERLPLFLHFFSPFLSDRCSPGSLLWVWDALGLLLQLSFCLPFYTWDYSAIHPKDYSCPS